MFVSNATKIYIKSAENPDVINALIVFKKNTLPMIEGQGPKRLAAENKQESMWQKPMRRCR